jgi:hypothetical protein
VLHQAVTCPARLSGQQPRHLFTAGRDIGLSARWLLDDARARDLAGASHVDTRLNYEPNSPGAQGFEALRRQRSKACSFGRPPLFSRSRSQSRYSASAGSTVEI